MTIHRTLTYVDNHVVHSLQYADASARTSAVLTSLDVGRVARQTSDDTFWVLTAAPGTWLQVFAPALVSFNGRTGAVEPEAGDYTATDVGAEPAGAVSTHAGASDPHTQYQKESEKDQANGYAGLDNAGEVSDTLHGNRSGADLHALATASLNGFMSAVDKARFDNLGSVTLTFKPGATTGNGIVATWAEVQAFNDLADGPWKLSIDDSLAPAEVPAGTTTDFKMQCTIDIVYGQAGGHLKVKDTGLIKNFLNLMNGAILVEAATTYGVLFDRMGMRSNLREGALISNVAGVSTVPAVRITPDFYVIASIESGAMSNLESFGQAGVPILELMSTNFPFYVIAQLVNTRGGATTIPADHIVGDASATLLNIHDAGDRLTPQSGFLGFINYVPIAFESYLAKAQGDTASRTAHATTGHMYFDTDLGKPIWFNGSDWVDSTGTVV